jgi:myo-inositol 2-dehydrogenase/D-chiro-inositol 1-dehydrogenase
VSIGTPHNTHLSIFEKLAPYVAGVLMEKPLEINLARARTISKLAKQHNVKVMMGFVHRFRDEVRAAYDAIQAGEIGKVGNLLESICSKGGNHPPRWVFDPEISGGGALMYTGVHSLDRLRWLAGGEVERVSALARNISSPLHPKIEDSLSAIFEFKNGAIGTLFENAPSHQFPGGWVSEVYGSTGAIRIQQQVNCAIGNGANHRLVPAGGDRFTATIEHFLSCLIESRPFGPDLHSGLANVALAEAIYRSDQTGHTVKVDEA